MSGETSDAALLARLNALRQSNISLSTGPSPGLQDRLKALRLGSAEPGPGKYKDVVPDSLEVGDFRETKKDNEEFVTSLAELGRERKWEDADEREVGEVLREAEEVLRERVRLEVEKEEKGEKSVVQGGEDEDGDGNRVDGERLKDPEAVTEDDIDDLLAELGLEEGYEGQFLRDEEDDSAHKDQEEHGETTPDHDATADDVGGLSLDLPDVPTTVKEATRPQETDLPDLDLPSVPASKLSAPSTSKKSTTTKPADSPPGDTDTENWCIICNDDATLRCLGCDGDLYCRNCWVEGHRGEDAGLEERSHKAMEYTKDKKKKAPPARKLAAA